MKQSNILLTCLLFLSLNPLLSSAQDDMDDSRLKETHVQNLRSITFQYENLAPYFDMMNQKVFFESNDPSIDIKSNRCYQVYSFNPMASVKDIKLISNGLGTCEAAASIGAQDIIYASTKQDKETCDPDKIYHPLRSNYLYLDPNSEIYQLNYYANTEIKLTQNEDYDGQCFVSKHLAKIVYVSTETGDPEIWTMDLNGENKVQITDELGMEAFPCMSETGERIIFCASRPQSIVEKEKYSRDLKNRKVSLERMELYSCNIDGTDMKKLTDLGHSVITPTFHFSGDKILFSSDHDKEAGRQIYSINADGTEMEQITYVGSFNAFPSLSEDGQFFACSSDRNLEGGTGINIVLGRWVD